MTAPLHAETVLIRNREAVQAALTRTTGAGLARVLRCDKSTTSRGKTSLRQLNGEEFVRLLAYDHELREDVVGSLARESAPMTDAPEVEVYNLLRPAAQATDHILGRLKDRHLSNPELRATVVELQHLIDIAYKGIVSCQAKLKQAQKAGRS